MKLPKPGNPVVFLDFQVDRELVGRMVIELRKDVVPKTAENFRRLCVGDFISPSLQKPLTYTGTKINSVKRMFAISGGIIKPGVQESIYGSVFPDENFELLHEAGAVSMANFGPNTNNSQFFITRTDCSNLDGTHVVFGYVLRGFDIIAEMEKVATEDGDPTVDITIVKSGELDSQQVETWNFYDPDDNLPPFPTDWAEAEQHFNELTDSSIQLLERIKCTGNKSFKEKDYVSSLRKYKKVARYHQFFMNTYANLGRDIGTSTSNIFAKLRLNNLLNMAACQLKLGQYRHVVSVCDEVLRCSPGQSKAYYRRAIANIELKDYERGLEDLKQAHLLKPNDPQINEQFRRGKTLLLDYRKTERNVSQKMFKALNL